MNILMAGNQNEDLKIWWIIWCSSSCISISTDIRWSTYQHISAQHVNVFQDSSGVQMDSRMILAWIRFFPMDEFWCQSGSNSSRLNFSRMLALSCYGGSRQQFNWWAQKLIIVMARTPWLNSFSNSLGLPKDRFIWTWSIERYAFYD